MSEYVVPDLRSSGEWLKDPEFSSVTIVDPDGWDRDGAFYASWREKIGREEFRARMMQSTVIIRAPE